MTRNKEEEELIEIFEDNLSEENEENLKTSMSKGRVEKVKKDLDLDAWSYLKEKGKGNCINIALYPTPQFTLRKVRRN